MMRLHYHQIRALGEAREQQRWRETKRRLQARYGGEASFEEWWEGLGQLADWAAIDRPAEREELGTILLELPDVDPPPSIALAFERVLLDTRRPAPERLRFLRKHLLHRLNEARS